MKKITTAIIYSCATCLISGIIQAQEPYVRKKVEPNFFIPQGALAQSRPEKVSLPQYRQGESTAKHISSDMPETDYEYVENTPLPSAIRNKNTGNKDKAESNAQETTSQTPLNNSQTTSEDTPNYQQMYQEYLKNLEDIARDGKISNNNAAKDISVMNSEERIKYDESFNRQLNVEQEIKDAIK